MASKLSKTEAYKLVTPVVDGEASEEEFKEFFDYIDSDSDVRIYYEEERWLKQLLRRKVIYEPAPERLKILISEKITQAAESERLAERRHIAASVRKIPGLALKYAIGFAALIALTFFIYLGSLFTGNTVGNPSVKEGLPILEERVHQFFMANEGSIIPPDIQTDSLDVIQAKLSQLFMHDYYIPDLNNVSFVGVVKSEFLPEYHTPLFEYKVDEDDIIYIFAFYIPELEGRLSRSIQAVSHCVGKTDYYIDSSGVMDLVSWKWDEFWYVGISNHDGETLASLLPR